MEPTDRTSQSPSGPLDTAPVPRGRPSRILIAAIVSELVVIAAVCNQGIVHALTKSLSTHSYADYSRGGIEAATTFGWRFAPQNGEPTHVWAAQFAAIGTLVVLTILGVLAVGRGVVTFGRVFVGTWAVVAAVTPVAIMVRELVVVPSAPGPLQSRVGQSVYGYPDFGPVIVAGLALGLVVGLVTGLIAVATRTKPRPVAEYGTDEDGEYLDSGYGYRPQQSSTYQPPPWGTEPGSSAPTSVQPPAYPPAAPQSPPWGEPQRPWESERQPSPDQQNFPEQQNAPERQAESTQQFAPEREFVTERQAPFEHQSVSEHQTESTQQFAPGQQTPSERQTPAGQQAPAGQQTPAGQRSAPAPGDTDPGSGSPAWQAWSAQLAPPAPPAPDASGDAPAEAAQSESPVEPQGPRAGSTPSDEPDATAQIPAVPDDPGRRSD